MGFADDFGSEVEKASAAVKGNGVFKPGFVGTVKIEEIKYLKEGFKGSKVITTVEILTSNSPEYLPGTKRDWFVNVPDGRNKIDESKRKRSWDDLKGLIFAVAMDTTRSRVGTPEQSPAEHAQASQMMKAHLDAAYAEQHKLDADAMIGLPVLLRTSERHYTNAEGVPAVFTLHSWEPAVA